MKAEWGRLTDNDRRILDGRIDQMLGIFQERYGYTREHAAMALNKYLGGHAHKTPMMPPPVGRWTFIAAVMLPLVSAVGWFVWLKMLSDQQPALSEPLPSATPELEAEDFEAALLGYDGALD
jgi:uncharacterized protein YjbJ (UPF0337 family)